MRAIGDYWISNADAESSGRFCCGGDDQIGQNTDMKMER